MKKTKLFTDEQLFQLSLKIMDNHKFKPSDDDYDNASDEAVHLTSEYMNTFLKVLEQLHSFYN